MSFTPTGVTFVAQNLSSYLSDLGKADRAQQDLGRSVAGIGGKFSTSQSQVAGFGSSLSKIITPAASLGSKLTSLAAGVAKIGALTAGAGVVALGAGLVKAAGAGFEFNSAMEMASAKIDAFTKDGAKTAEILEDVRQEAAKTPFEFQAMADATAGLLPAAKQAGEGIMDLVKDAEILAASNPTEGLEGAAFALREAVSGDFTSVIERFNLPRQMINQLKEEGLPNIEIVRRAMGEMGFDMDLVSNLANTASGRWSTLKDNFTNLAGTVTKPIFDTFSQSLGKVNDWLSSNEPMLTNLATLLAGRISEGITTVATKAGELFAAFQAGGFKGLAESLGIPPETYDAIVNITTKVGELFTTIAGYGGFGLAGILMVDPAAREALMGFFSDLWTWLKINIPAAITTVSDIWNNDLKPGFAEIAGVVSEQLFPALQNLFNAFSSGTGGTQTMADLWNNTLWPALQNVGAFIRDVLFPAWVDLEVFLVGALSVAITTLAGYWENVLFPAISAVSGFVKDTVIPALSDLWDWLGPKIGDGIQALSDLWTNTLQPAMVAVWSWSNENLLPLLESIGNLFNAVIGKALEGAAGLWQNVLLPALKKVGGYLKDTVFPVFSDVAQVVKDEASPILRELGEVVFPILQEGLDYVTAAIQDVIAYFDSLADKVSSFSLPDILTPGSPPPFAYALMDIATGANQAAEAIKNMGLSTQSASQFIGDLDMGGIARALGGGGSGWKEMRRHIHGGIKANFQELMTSGMSPAQIIQKVQETAAKFNFPPSFASEFAQANGLIEHLTSSAKEFQQAMRIQSMGRIAEVAGGFASLGQSFAEMLRPAVDERAGIIKRLQNFVKSGDQGLFKFDFAPHLVGVDHVMMDRIRAQEQLNLLLREQREQEALITKQMEAQQKLDFLQQQIDLIKMGKELGGNIFQGITFGLEARVEDLLAATNAITMAMVNQINSDLQISSPSKLMIKTFEQVMAGAAIGMERGESMLTNAVRSIPILNGNIPQPAFSQAAMAGGGNTTINEYNFPMSVATAATPQGVIRQYEIKRSMYATG